LTAAIANDDSVSRKTDQTFSRSIPKLNNMDLLRLVFASLVVFAHSYDLTLNPALQVLRSFAKSTIAVQGFFILSGFLVVMSYERSKTIGAYASKRARRIYPAYLTVILFCALAGAFLTTLPLRQYIGLDLLKYLAANLTFMNFLRPNLPGLFDGNVLNAVNGALWTIKIEVAFYIAVPFICLFIRRLGPLPVIIAIYLLSLAYQMVFDHLYETTGRSIFDLLGKFLPGQMTFFISGAALFYYFDQLMAARAKVAVIGVVLLALGWGLGLTVVTPVGMALTVFAIAFGPYLGNVAKYGDFSYGTYIWHFPIIQTMIMFGAFAAAPLLSSVTAFCLALVAAVASWHFVEKPWLSRTSHYVEVTS
jgi:peptidoglycan/LPS O-acetylase OafA/YrhL